MRRQRQVAFWLVVCAVSAAFWGLSKSSVVGEKVDGPEVRPPNRLCVIWSSGDPGVAENVCFMYTHAAKRAGWFETVHLVVWGPSAKLLAEDANLQRQIARMQKSGVTVEACVACASNYGVADALRAMDIDVKPMGAPLSDRLKESWKILTF